MHTFLQIIIIIAIIGAYRFMISYVENLVINEVARYDGIRNKDYELFYDMCYHSEWWQIIPKLTFFLYLKKLHLYDEHRIYTNRT